MLTLRLISIGTLKEAYWRDAAQEYEKRLGTLCRFQSVNLKEAKLPDKPSDGEIAAALEVEADAVLREISPRSYVVALCVEGEQMSSPALAQTLEKIAQTHSEITLIIGSSYGLSPRVKKAADCRLSVSKLTFPHQLMRVLILEVFYRAFQIQKGTQYHK